MKYKIGIVFSVLLALVGCKSTANYDYDNSVNFSAIKTYAWVIESKASESEPDYFKSDINNKRIIAAIESNLETKGLRKVAPNEANILVNYHTSTKEGVERDLASTNAAYWNFGRGYHHSRLSTHINLNSLQRSYKEGSLIIDFLNPQSEVIWRGSDETRLSKQSTPEKRLEKVNKVVGDILLNFLP